MVPNVHLVYIYAPILLIKNTLMALWQDHEHVHGHTLEPTLYRHQASNIEHAKLLDFQARSMDNHAIIQLCLSI